VVATAVAGVTDCIGCLHAGVEAQPTKSAAVHPHRIFLHADPGLRCRLDRFFVFGHAAGERGDEANAGSGDSGVKVSERLSANDVLELQDDLSRLHQNGDAVLYSGDRYRLSLRQSFPTDR
jgi:hypothetical protein